MAQTPTDPAYIEKLVHEAEQKSLSEQSQWRRLLFWREGRFFSSDSLFDDPDFFLSGLKGKKDPKGELTATIRRLLGPEKMQLKKEVLHPQCVFPARFEFLKESLNLDLSKIQLQDCPKLKTFLKFANYDRVSLVFSNYFADNPGSMFGHTLLRMHRKQNAVSMGLLDDAANFAAQIPVMNPVTYPIEGLMGFFRGRFALVPYAEKIQEYSNFESRDLWEYELDLKPEEVRRLSLVLWEVGYFWMDYYYLDENCSFVILALLEVARPSLQLTNQFHIYAIPADTVKATARVPGLVKKIEFKPSALTRYLERANGLNEKEVKIFKEIEHRFPKTFAKDEFDQIIQQAQCDPDCQIRVYDALAEYIDFREKKISYSKVELYEGLRKGLLLARARIAKPSLPLSYRPEHTRPDLGPMSSMIEFASGWTNQGLNNSEFRWRPALHDLTSKATGYSEQLQIAVMDTIVARNQELDRVYLKKFSPLGLSSLGRHELGLSPKSWRVDLSFDTDRPKDRARHWRANKKSGRKANGSNGDSDDPADQLTHRSTLEVGFGAARFSQRAGAYVLANFVGGYSDDPELFWHLGAGPRLGFFWNVTDSVKWTTMYTFIKSYGRRSLERQEALSRVNWFFKPENEAFFEARDQDDTYYFGVGYRMFY